VVRNKEKLKHHLLSPPPLLFPQAQLHSFIPSSSAPCCHKIVEGAYEPEGCSQFIIELESVSFSLHLPHNFPVLQHGSFPRAIVPSRNIHLLQCG